MSKRINDIQDDDFRIIGSTQSEALKIDKSKGKTRWYIYMLAIVICLAAGLTLLLTRAEDPAQEAEVEVVFDPMPIQQEEPIEEEIKPLGDYDEGDSKAYTEHLRDTINDIPLDIYIPHNAVPELMVGVPDIHDKTIILTTQAADVRADNGKIVGAFVVNGKPLSWGLSKKGYCGIIDGELTVGVADNSPLFEEATEKGGYFFRQYPLVDNGVLVENEPKGKSIRKALCDRNGEIMIVMTQTPESFHDFAQALVDMKIDNAIYTVGSNSYGYFRDKYDHFEQIYEKRRGGYKYENFIVWRDAK
jgi:hypothetical protein